MLRPPSDEEGFGLGLAAGDVNGDGVSDVVVGSVLSTANGLSNAGRVFVFFGGFAPNAAPDLILMSPTPEAEARFGWGIAIGDVNGDGFGDMIVSALLANGGDRGGRGEAYVFFGGPLINAQADMTLQSPGGLGANAHFGWSMAAGDINGDSIDDIVIGAETVRVMGTDQAGEAYVYLGRRSFTGTLDFTLRSPTLERASSFGNAVAVVDLNRDGFKDVAIAAPGQSTATAANAGQVFLFLGGPVFDVTTDLMLRAGEPRRFGRFGIALAAGDVNGDNVPDLIVGATNPPPPPLGLGPRNLGEINVFLGGGAISPTPQFTLDQRSVNGLGSALATGDVNRDGRSDIIAGVASTDAGGVSAAGTTLIFFGGSTLGGAANITLQSPAPTRNELFGTTVASGDFNGDRLTDVMVGAIFKSVVPPAGPGKAFVFLGQ